VGHRRGAAGFGSGAIWPSFSTGVNPRKHGRYFYRQVGSAGYGAERFEATDFKAAAVWEVLERSGPTRRGVRRAEGGTRRGLNGIQAVDWIAHGPVYKRLVTWPPEFGDELARSSAPIRCRAAIGPAGAPLPSTPCCATSCSAAYARKRPAPCTTSRASRGTCSSRCLQIRTVSDINAGTCAILLTPCTTRTLPAQVGDPVLDVYSAIDTAIGRIAAAAGPDADVIVFSGTGMAANYSGNHVLDEILRAWRANSAAPPRLAHTSQARAEEPPSIRRTQALEEHRAPDRGCRGARRPRAPQCFAVPHNDIAGAVRVNLAGREPNGHVQPAPTTTRSSRSCGATSSTCATWTRQPDRDGRRAHRRGLHGAHSDELPDFFVLWNREAPIERIGSPKIGTIELVHRGNRTGDHRPESVYVAAGPHVVPGYVEPVSILDFAPTLASIHGVTLPDCDGRVIAALARPNRSRAA
jgi:hypothetical protein